MKNMSKAVRDVIDYYGFKVDQVGDLVAVRSGNGEVTFRRVNNTYYKVFSHRRQIVHVSKLIDWLEEL